MFIDVFVTKFITFVDQGLGNGRKYTGKITKGHQRVLKRVRSSFKHFCREKMISLSEPILPTFEKRYNSAKIDFNYVIHLKLVNDGSINFFLRVKPFIIQVSLHPRFHCTLPELKFKRLV